MAARKVYCRRFVRYFSFLLLLLFFAAFSSAAERYVYPQQQLEGGLRLNFAGAGIQYPNIQAAIDDACNGDIIYLAPGRFSGSGNRDLDFNGKAITVSSLDPNDPCVVAATIIDCNGEEGEYRGFYFHSGESLNSLLEGVTITNGKCLYFSTFGGAIYCINSSPKISKCLVERNYAGYGAIALLDSNAVISNCIIRKNYTEGCGSGAAGIFIMSNHSNILVEHSAIVENTAKDRYPGGLGVNVRYPWMSEEDINESNCILVNCLIAGNSPSGVTCDTKSTVWMYSSDVSDNKGFGITIKGLVYFINSILWNNNSNASGNDVSLEGTSTNIAKIIFEYSTFDPRKIYISWQDGWRGAYEVGLGCITFNRFIDPNFSPCFVRQTCWNDNGTPDYDRDDYVETLGDYHLKSEGWRWDADTNQWTWDDVTSRCIDAGNPGYSLGDEPITLSVDPLHRFGVNKRIDMGAYGGTAEASMPPYGWALLSDIDNNGKVNFVDFYYLANYYLQEGEKLNSDLNRDGAVNLKDLSLIALDWLKFTDWAVGR